MQKDNEEEKPKTYYGLTSNEAIQRMLRLSQGDSINAKAIKAALPLALVTFKAADEDSDLPIAVPRELAEAMPGFFQAMSRTGKAEPEFELAMLYVWPLIDPTDLRAQFYQGKFRSELIYFSIRHLAKAFLMYNDPSQENSKLAIKYLFQVVLKIENSTHAQRLLEANMSPLGYDMRALQWLVLGHRLFGLGQHEKGVLSIIDAIELAQSKVEKNSEKAAHEYIVSQGKGLLQKMFTKPSNTEIYQALKSNARIGDFIHDNFPGLGDAKSKQFGVTKTS